MEFVTAGLRERLLGELATASQVDIAVAYFSPEPSVLAALAAVPKLRLLVSSDFQVNNPFGLESLHQAGHWVRALSPEEHGGNLHAKVYLVTRKDRSLWAMVGSANLTRPGLTSNQEACVLLDSKVQADAAQLGAIRAWVHDRCSQDIPEIDFELARAVYHAQGQQQSKSPAATAATAYWALKPGRLGEFWQNWLAEKVISIGWRQLPDTSVMTRPQAEAAYRAARPGDADGQVNTNVPQILNFTRAMQAGQLVLVCGRYDGVGDVDRDVYVYGLARTIEVDGRCYFFDAKSTWHRCKRHARIQRIEASLPRSLVAEALRRWSFVPTILQLDHPGFAALEAVLRTELGVVINV